MVPRREPYAEATTIVEQVWLARNQYMMTELVSPLQLMYKLEAWRVPLILINKALQYLVGRGFVNSNHEFTNSSETCYWLSPKLGPLWDLNDIPLDLVCWPHLGPGLLKKFELRIDADLARVDKMRDELMANAATLTNEYRRRANMHAETKAVKKRKEAWEGIPTGILVQLATTWAKTDEAKSKDVQLEIDRRNAIARASSSPSDASEGGDTTSESPSSSEGPVIVDKAFWEIRGVVTF